MHDRPVVESCISANAALPHGSGTDRVLQQDEFALFDCGGSLHGYISDVTRVSGMTSLPDQVIF
jgi:Xaa-Pro aminopeptidase